MRRRIVAVVLAMVCLLFCAPVLARADADMPRVDIKAIVGTDGSLNVSETRTFSFNDAANGVYWTFANGQNQQGAMSTTVVGSVSEDGVSLARVESAENGQGGVYTVEEDVSGDLSLKVYTPHEAGDEARITVNYTVAGAVMAWSDTAELYWKYVGADWPNDSDDVHLSVTFLNAAASGVQAKTGSDGANLRAWGHGPLDGVVSLDADGPSVSYDVPTVPAGDVAEARIVFPAAWVPDLQAVNQMRLPDVLSEEQTWADQANARREHARLILYVLTGMSIGLPALFCLVVLVFKWRHPNPKPTFTDEYFRDLPSRGHPAIISAFMSGRKADGRALLATLMNLCDEHVVRIAKTTREARNVLGKKREEEDYELSVDAEDRRALTDKIDRAALVLYLGDGGTAVAFGEMEDIAKKEPELFRARWKDFQDEVAARQERWDLVESDGVLPFVIACVAGGALAVGEVASALYLGSPLPLIGLPLVVAGILVASTLRRLTQKGVDLQARCRALKHWLEDFTRLGAAAPGDVVLWNKLLVMAVALGVSDRVLKELAAATPRAFDEAYADGSPYYPSWWWLRRHGNMDAPIRAMHRVSDVSVAVAAGSASSSGSGFGGGFSGGGGGGVGGGGGGTF